MARARGGGGSGSAWALVFFGAGFFICLLLAIVFFTQVSGAKQGEQNAKSKLAEFASPSEQSSPEIETLRADGDSVVGALMLEREWLRILVANDQNKSKPEIEESLKSLGLEGASLLQEVASLQNELSGSNNLKQTLEQELATARTRANDAEQAKSELDQSYKDSLGSLQATVDQTTDALDSTRQKIQEQKTTLDGEMAGTREEYVDQIAALEQELSDTKKVIDSLRKELFAAGGKLGQDSGPGNLTKADGRIISVIGGRSEVFLSLGRADRLQMGMTFEVFGANELVKLTEYGELRGKATLEVVSVDESASLARVVRLTRGRSITEGDAIINLVYDPQATYKFYVYGDFKLEGSSGTGADGKDRIISKIVRWGGEVSNELSYDVDYLILGEPPPLPPAEGQGDVDPVRIAQRVQAQREYQTYQELIGAATSPSLNIPVLNQNRFLALVGEYDR